MSPTCACCGSEKHDAVELHCNRAVAICPDCVSWLSTRVADQRAGRTGGWIVTSHSPVFIVTDIDRAIDHYEKMGFTVNRYDDTYAFAERDSGLSIHLELARDGTPAPSAVYVQCDDADAVFEAWRLAGLVSTAPQPMPWGRHEGVHTDPDGNVVRFGSPVRRDR